VSSSSAIYSGKSRTLPSIPVRQLVAGMAPMLLLYFLYTVVRFLVKDRGPVEGIRNSHHVLHLEQRLGFDWEVSLQEITLPHEWLVKAANWYYVIGFLPVVLVCASIAALFDFQTFLWWRKRFAVTLLLALVGFALYPLAPPRMLPGMVDTLMVYGPRYYGDSHGSSLFNAYGRLPSMVNVYAAMPSMHVAWSIIAGALLVSAFKGRWWAWMLGISHPVLMGMAVIVTANHYLLDVVVGVLALLGALFLLYSGEQIMARFVARRADG
jgi:hypothetical protein